MQNPSLTLAAAPASEPLVLSDVKTYLRVSGSAEDALITSVMQSVRETAEKFLRTSMITQSWKLAYDQYAPSEVLLAMGPVQSITSVTAFARDESSNVINSASYYLNAGKRVLIFDATPISNRIEIIYVTGYGDDASDVPNPIKQGMMAHIASIYDGRAGVNTIPPQALSLYGPYRVWRV